jgi:hypothetical protein
MACRFAAGDDIRRRFGRSVARQSNDPGLEQASVWLRAPNFTRPIAQGKVNASTRFFGNQGTIGPPFSKN